jgi:uncharacterized membrane-anchored protein
VIRNILFLISTLLILGVLNFLIVQKENLLANGQTVYLRLTPVDPLSLMQGNYMSLRYSDDTFPPEEAFQNQKSDGRIMMKLDENRVATFTTFVDSIGPKPDEIILRYRKRDSIRIIQDSFFIQEGTDYLYSRARYAQIKVDKNGESLLVGLCDEKFARLGPARR